MPCFLHAMCMKFQAERSRRNKREALDLIEKREGVWIIVAPVFAAWLASYGWGILPSGRCGLDKSALSL